MDEASSNIVAKFSTCKSENANMNETLPEAQRTPDAGPLSKRLLKK